MPGAYTFYDGSRLLEPLADFCGLSVDKVNFVICQLSSLPLALAYYHWCAPGKVNRNIRLGLPILLGIAICYFCFGSAIKHVLLLAGICYILMRLTPIEQVHRFIFITAMGYLTYIHLYRSFVLTQYNLDVTGLMMVSVQKLTSLAFSLHDAHSKEVINERQKKEAVRECPSVLELASYLFHFQGILTGPLCFYKDYIEFIDDKKRESKPWQIVKQKLGASTLFLALVIFFGDSMRPELLLEAETLKLSTLRWAILFYMMMIFQRLQYYFGWVMADAVYNASGFGYSNGKWNLMSNVYPWRLETALNFKETLDAWNCLTMAWLRRTAYEPLPAKYRTIGTYLLSAWWHGFFPGYYLTFATGALFTIAARSVRRHLRPHFQGNDSMRVLYDCITWLTNTAALTYATYPFVTLHFATGLTLYRHTYFCLHIMALLAIFVLPRILPVSRRKKEIGDENNKSE